MQFSSETKNLISYVLGMNKAFIQVRLLAMFYLRSEPEITHVLIPVI